MANGIITKCEVCSSCAHLSRGEHLQLHLVRVHVKLAQVRRNKHLNMFLDNKVMYHILRAGAKHKIYAMNHEIVCMCNFNHTLLVCIHIIDLTTLPNNKYVMVCNL